MEKSQKVKLAEEMGAGICRLTQWVVSDELKEASEQGGGGIWRSRGRPACGGSRGMGDAGLGAEKGFGGSRAYWVSVVAGAMGRDWAVSEVRAGGDCVEAFAMKPALDGAGRGSGTAHVEETDAGRGQGLPWGGWGGIEGGVRTAGRVAAERWGAEERQGRPEVRSRLLAGQFRGGAAQAVEWRGKTWVDEELRLNPRRSGDS